MTRRRTRLQNHRRGHRAERLAQLYLLSKAYLPLKRRYKTPLGEIDLIARRGRRLIFVEVKARAHAATAAEAIHVTNQQRVVRAAQYFLSRHPKYTNYEIRFDAVLVAWYRWPKHIADAFR